MEARDDAPEPAATAASVTVIPVDERLPASAELADVVGSAAGVHVHRLGGLGDFSTIAIRGSAARQVEVYVDGVPLNPHGGSAVNLAELPLDAFERIEVYRSGAPVELGSAAMGGVVNLVTAPGEVPAPRFELTAGSHWTARASARAGVAGRAGRGARAAPLDVVLAGEVLSSRNDYRYLDDRGTPYNLFDDRTRTRGNADVLQVDARARLRVGRRALRWTLQDAVTAREQGLPGIGQDPAAETRLGVVDNLLLAQLEGRPHPLLGVRTRMSWRARRERYRDPLGELGVGRQDSTDQHHGLTALVHGSWVPLAWMALGLSAELRVEGYHPGGAGPDAGAGEPRARVAAVLGVSDDLSLAGDRVRISPAAQLHLLDDRLLAAAPSGTAAEEAAAGPGVAALSPRIGLLVRPLPPLAIKASAGRFFRPPDFLELFGDRGVVVGNDELVPEHGWSWDAGVRAETPRGGPAALAAESAVFWRDTRDTIVFVQNAQRTQIPVNHGRTRVFGVEAAVEARLGRVVDLRGAFTGLASEVLEGQAAYVGKQLPRLPAAELTLGAEVHWREVVRAGYTFSYTAGNYWDATNWNLAAPRSLHGVFLRLQPGPRWPALELEIRNLTDRRVQVVPRDPLNPDDGARVVQPLTDFLGYPLPGRVVLVTLRGTLPGEGRGSP